MVTHTINVLGLFRKTDRQIKTVKTTGSLEPVPLRLEEASVTHAVEIVQVQLDSSKDGLTVTYKKNSTKEPGVVAYTHNSCSWETEVEGSP